MDKCVLVVDDNDFNRELVVSHFAHFCKDSFGDTPRALRKKAAGGEKIGKVQ